MAQASRPSLESEPDLVAYDSSSILPGAGSGYSYGPPASATPSENMSRLSLDKLNNNGSIREDNNNSSTSATSPGFSNRSRARATSIASKFSNATLPLYSAREASSGLPTASSSTSRGPLNGRRTSTSSNEQSDNDNENDEDDYDGYSDDDDLEMDTLNKNSGGKGGWKMVANTDTPLSALFSPSTQNLSPNDRSMSHAENPHEKMHGAHPHKGGKNSRFERFDKLEWIAMSTSLVFVAFLTVASLMICFNGS